VIGEFISILLIEKIEMVADVRTIPRSRTDPQFNPETLRTTLSEPGIEYMHLATVGHLRYSGPRPTKRSFPGDVRFQGCCGPMPD
jgi:uncharacterized protein (DUF488 family)